MDGPPILGFFQQRNTHFLDNGNGCLGVDELYQVGAKYLDKVNLLDLTHGGNRWDSCRCADVVVGARPRWQGRSRHVRLGRRFGCHLARHRHKLDTVQTLLGSIGIFLRIGWIRMPREHTAGQLHRLKTERCLSLVLSGVSLGATSGRWPPSSSPSTAIHCRLYKASRLTPL
jgi:hypothetical protein